MSTQLIDRYPGARPFADDPNDQSLFFGRDEEIETLFHRVCAARLLVLFGKSGLGKTSLLQAGIFPKLRVRHMLPIPVRLNIQESPLAIIKISADEVSRNFRIDYTPGEGDTLWEFFKTVMFWRGEVLLTPVLVFDQFEEIFTLKNTEERAVLASELGDLLRGTLPPSVRQKRQSPDASGKAAVTPSGSLSELAPNVRVILSLREDYLGALQEIAADIPGIFDDRVRLSPLSDEQAEKAIRKPAGLSREVAPGGQFATAPFAYADDALAEMLGYLRGKSEIIEPFQLQLVCRDIEEQVAHQQAKENPIAVITSKELGGRKRLDKIVQNFYRQTLAKLPRRDRRYAQRLCEEGLLNAEGFRLPLQENEILKSYKLSAEALTALVDARLLRKEPRLESYFYELSHDSLVQPIIDSRPWKLTRKQRAFSYGAAVILIIVMVFGYWQFRAKQEAQAAEQRAQQAREAAEEILDYLVFDLRDKFAPLGRLDIVEEVQQRVNGYYEKMGTEGQSATVLHRRGAAYASEGDRLLTQGKLVQAQEAYQKFLAISQKNSANEPNDTVWKLSVSIAFRKLGDSLFRQGKLAEAQEHFQEGLAITLKLTAQEPNNTDWQWEKSAIFYRLGDLLNAQGKLTEAQHYYQEGLAIMQKLTSLVPDNTRWQRDMTTFLNRLGDLLNAQGKQSEAERYYQDGLAIGQKLTSLDQNNTEWQRDVSISHQNLGIVLAAQKKIDEAVDAFKKSMDIRERLASHDPSNATWQSDLTWTYDQLLPLLVELNRYSEAADIAQRRLAHLLKLANPQANKQTLSEAYLNLAWYELLNQQPEKTIEASEQGLKLNADDSTNTELNTNLAHGYLFNGQYEKAKAIYLDNMDKKFSDDRRFRQAVLDDYKEFRKRGINLDDMKRIEKLLHD